MPPTRWIDQERPPSRLIPMLVSPSLVDHVDVEASALVGAVEPVRRAALLLREVLDEHVEGDDHVQPGGTAWDELWTFSKALGAALVKRAPKELTRAFYRSQRRGRLYVNTARARRGHLAIVPWTARARPGAPVAVPLRWEELGDGSVNARRWTLRDALERPEDPWDGAAFRGQSLAAAAAVLGAG